MEFMDLDSFEIKWNKKIKEFLTITKDGSPSNLFEFEEQKESIFDKENKGTEESENIEKSFGELKRVEEDSETLKAERLKELMDMKENSDLDYFGTDNIKEMSDDVLSIEPKVEMSDDIKSFSAKDAGLDFDIKYTKVDQRYFLEFFNDFSRIKLNSFKESENQKRLPESSYAREIFTVSSVESLKSYVFYMLLFKVDCLEYKVMKIFLEMCYLYQRLPVKSNYPLTISLKKLCMLNNTDRLNLSALYLRIGMLLPKSGTQIVK